jgi:hypothetical protein
MQTALANLARAVCYFQFKLGCSAYQADHEQENDRADNSDEQCPQIKSRVAGKAD